MEHIAGSANVLHSSYLMLSRRLEKPIAISEMRSDLTIANSPVMAVRSTPMQLPAVVVLLPSLRAVTPANIHA